MPQEMGRGWDEAAEVQEWEGLDEELLGVLAADAGSLLQ